MTSQIPGVKATLSPPAYEVRWEVMSSQVCVCSGVTPASGSTFFPNLRSYVLSGPRGCPSFRSQVPFQPLVPCSFWDPDLVIDPPCRVHHSCHSSCLKGISGQDVVLPAATGLLLMCVSNPSVSVSVSVQLAIENPSDVKFHKRN